MIDQEMDQTSMEKEGWISKRQWCDVWREAHSSLLLEIHGVNTRETNG
jgi:hypothetical protein